MMHRLAVLVASALVVAACASGPSAPPIDGRDVACADTVCIAYPSGWEVIETGPDFIRFQHPSAPNVALATVGPTNMEAVVVQAGGTWPARPVDVVEAFWRLLEETGVGELATTTPVGDGAVRSMGAYEGGRLWYLLVPTGTSRAIGVEVRGPDASWESHADVFFSEVVPIP